MITIPVNVLLDFTLRCLFFHNRIATLSSYQSGYLLWIRDYLRCKNAAAKRRFIYVSQEIINKNVESNYTCSAEGI